MNEVDLVLDSLEKQLVAALATVRMLREANKPKTDSKPAEPEGMGQQLPDAATEGHGG